LPDPVIVPVTSTVRLKSIYKYNADGTLLSAKNLKGDSTSFVYGLYGQPSSVTEHAIPTWQSNTSQRVLTNQTTSFTYDATTKNTTVVTHDGRTVSYQYDSFGNAKKFTNQLAKFTDFTYDSLNWQKTITQWDGASARTTAMAYDDDGNRKTLTDPRNVARNWTYHPRGMLETMTDEFGASESHAYDQANNLPRLRDRQSDSIWTVYDALNRPTTTTIGQVKVDDTTELNTLYGDFLSEVAFRDPMSVGTVLTPQDAISFQYDPVGRVKRVENNDAVVTRTFFKQGAIDKDSTWLKFNSQAFVLRYTYNRDGTRKQMTTPGRAHTYAYDTQDGSLTSISYPANGAEHPAGTVAFRWDALGRQDSLSLPTGVSSVFRYDLGGRVRRIESKIVSTGTKIVNSNFAYDNADRLLSVADSGVHSVGFQSGASNTWTYDDLGRALTQRYSGSWEEDRD
jgi:YD repeat-containing protein